MSAQKALTAAILVTLAAGCVPSAPEQTPAPTPAAPPPPAPPPPPVAALPAPTYDNWLDAPQTPGDWRYTAQEPATQATFVAGAGASTARLTIICDLGTRRVGIARAMEATGVGDRGPAQMRIRTETVERLLQAQPQPQPRAQIQGNALLAELAASDPLFDAMAFTKGRFAVETAGEQTLYVPAYPEISRVIEDCRGGSL